MTCPDCSGTRAVPDDVTGGYAPSPACVIDAGPIFVALDVVDGVNGLAVIEGSEEPQTA